MKRDNDRWFWVFRAACLFIMIQPASVSAVPLDWEQVCERAIYVGARNNGANGFEIWSYNGGTRHHCRELTTGLGVSLSV